MLSKERFTQLLDEKLQSYPERLREKLREELILEFEEHHL